MKVGTYVWKKNGNFNQFYKVFNHVEKILIASIIFNYWLKKRIPFFFNYSYIIL